MEQKNALSSALRITDINDFLSPSAACVLPVGGGALSEAKEKSLVRVKPEPAGSVLAPIVPTATKLTGSAKAKVTVSDCLSCSGCVTSAETVLLSTESIDALNKFVGNPNRTDYFSVVALSQQAVASVAVHYNLSLTSTAGRLTTFLKRFLGFEAVIDLSFPRHIALLEAKQEFISRFRSGNVLTITSACPGWVTYAEKTQDANILDNISSVRSPQGVLGAIAEYLRPSKDHRPVWVSTIMMCHDKKLEASRPELFRDTEEKVRRKEVDCVLTTGELVDLMEERAFDILSAEETQLDTAHAASVSSEFGVNVGSGSGGFADFVLKAAAKELLGVSLPTGPLITNKASKSGDLKTFSVSSGDGSKTLTFATAYGFRCLQSILRKIRRGECTYNYIELMACPGGCNNGGGQLPSTVATDDNSKSLKRRENEHLQRVESVFHDCPDVNNPLDIPSVSQLYSQRLGGYPASDVAKQNTRMLIQQRKTNALSSLSW